MKRTNNKGITLVALVVTIAILMILASVTINAVLGDNGLIKQAEKAKDIAENSIAKENEDMNLLLEEYANMMAEDSETTPSEPENPIESGTVEEAKEDETKFEETTIIKDGQDNSVVIPGGFHVDKDSGTNVEDGIVIEDDVGNQFVWIPVGIYHTVEGDKINNLSRRSWGEKDAVQQPTEISGDSVINSYYYGEGATQDEDGQPIITVAKDQIGEFRASATNKGGFYIGRYEAGTEIERTSESDSLTTPLVKANKNAYVYVTRDEAKTQSEAMYSGNKFVISELISSYAWDTALNFICQNSEEGYKLATTTDKTYGNINTGKKEKTGIYTADNYCNIHDMLGNCYEWTTEYCSVSDSSCIDRGAHFNQSLYYAAGRYGSSMDTSRARGGFRIQLYIK